MRKLSICIAALAMMLLSAQNTFGQRGGMLFAFGGASYRMDDMKYLQEHILSTYPVEGKITSSFPPFTSSSITMFKQLYDQIRIGGGYSYSTTGGKSSYADYSGNLSTEITASSHRLGAYLSYTLLGGDHFDLSLYGRVDANLTSLTIQSSYTILNYSNSIYNKYRSISPVGFVGTELMYKFNDFSLGMDAGYLVDLTGNLKDTEEGDTLLDPNDRERVLTSDWTGWQVHITALIWLKF